VPNGLIRIYGRGEWHFITCSCYRRLPFLGAARHREVFLKVLEQTRKKYQFVVAGYVVMPEHIHLLVGEPQIANPSRFMQVLKQRVSLQCRASKRAAKQQLTIFSNQLPPAFW
jgi:putative transposase